MKVKISGIQLKISCCVGSGGVGFRDRKSTRLNSSHLGSSYAVFCLKKKTRVSQQEGPALCRDHKTDGRTQTGVCLRAGRKEFGRRGGGSGLDQTGNAWKMPTWPHM